jgi:hypothetical protein
MTLPRLPLLPALFLGLLVAASGCAAAQVGSAAPAPATHVVFVTGDEEYRSEETMPMLARILQRDHGFRVTVLTRSTTTATSTRTAPTTSRAWKRSRRRT